MVEAKDADAFIAAASKENLEATRVALVTPSRALSCAGRGRVVCDIAREFLNSNGAEKACAGRAGCPQLKGTGGRRHIQRKNAQPCGQPECLLEGLIRTVRFHHRRGHGADALRQAPPAPRHSGHGR